MTLTVSSETFSPDDIGGYDSLGLFYGNSVASITNSIVGEDMFATFNGSAIAHYASTLIQPTITLTYTLSSSDFFQTQQIFVRAIPFASQSDQNLIESNSTGSINSEESNSISLLDNGGNRIDKVGVYNQSVTTTDDVTKFFSNNGFDTAFSFGTNDSGITNLSNVSVTVTGLVATNLPVVSGTVAFQPVLDDVSSTPFAGVTISDPSNPRGVGDQLTVKIVDADGNPTASLGRLSLPDDPSALTDNGDGTYSFSPVLSAIDRQADLEKLVFTPAAVTTPLGVQVAQFAIVDSVMRDPLEKTTDNGTSALIVHDARGLSLGVPVSGTDAAPFSAFAGVSVADPYPGDLVKAIILVLDGAGTLSGTGLSGSNGFYTLASTDAASLTQELQGLQFIAKTGVVDPGQHFTAMFEIDVSASDGWTASAKDRVVVTSVAPPVAPVIYGSADLTIGPHETARPFASAVVVDDNANSSDLLMIQLSDNGAGGTLSGSSILRPVVGAPGKYVLFDSPAQLTADLQSLVFTPSRAGATSFTLTDVTTDGLNAGNSAFKVTVDAGPTVGTARVTVAAGSTTEITAAILASVTPGLPNDVEKVTAIGSSSPNGSETLSGGRVTFTASGGTLDHIPANGSATVSFTDTITDAVRNVANGTVLVTVTNTATNIFGDPYGHSITQGTTGTDVITAYGYNDTINTNGDDTVHAGAGQATVNASGGDVVVRLAGQNDIVNGDDGNDTVTGSQGNTRVTLGNGNDSVTLAGDGNTVTLGNGSNSVVVAGATTSSRWATAPTP